MGTTTFEVSGIDDGIVATVATTVVATVVNGNVCRRFRTGPLFRCGRLIGRPVGGFAAIVVVTVAAAVAGESGINPSLVELPILVDGRECRRIVAAARLGAAIVVVLEDGGGAGPTRRFGVDGTATGVVRKMSDGRTHRVSNP